MTAIASAGPAELIELVRQALVRAHGIGCLTALADAIDSTIKSARTPTEDLGLVPTETAPVAAPTEVAR